jgi:transcriptional regulator with XRE-family HTH domain
MRKDRERVAVACGHALRQTRASMGISQEELALRAGVDRTFVSKVERGQRQPALATIILLAKALDIRRPDATAR